MLALAMGRPMGGFRGSPSTHLKIVAQTVASVGPYALKNCRPGAHLAERLGRPHRLVVWSSIVARLAILAIALWPFSGRADLISVVAFATLRAAFGQLLAPAWTAVAADIVPADVDFVIDCIDSLNCKVALVATSVERGLKVASSMGAGNKLDPTRIRIADISKTSMCPLAAVMRKRLRLVLTVSGFGASISPF